MITRIARSVRQRLMTSPDDGLSLMELIIAMMMGTFVMAIVGTMFINVAFVTTNSNASTTRTSTAANIIDELSKVIRTAANNPVLGQTAPDSAVIAGTPTSLTLYTFVDADPANVKPTKVRFRLDAQNNVVEDRWAATLSQGYWVFTGSETSRTIGGPIINVSGNDVLFIYKDSNDVTLVPGQSGLTAADRAKVTSIQVTSMILNNPTTGNDNLVIVNTVGMPNLRTSGSAP
jgi:Tfp pilus assembly protein PilW